MYKYGRPDKFKPRRDRRVNSLTVECPNCGAPLGTLCQTIPEGIPRQNPHPIRRRLAVRLANYEEEK